MSNVGIVQRAYEAFIGRDLETVVALLDPQVEWVNPKLCHGVASTAGQQRV